MTTPIIVANIVKVWMWNELTFYCEMKGYKVFTTSSTSIFFPLFPGVFKLKNQTWCDQEQVVARLLTFNHLPLFCWEQYVTSATVRDPPQLGTSEKLHIHNIYNSQSGETLIYKDWCHFNSIHNTSLAVLCIYIRASISDCTKSWLYSSSDHLGGTFPLIQYSFVLWWY